MLRLHLRQCGSFTSRSSQLRLQCGQLRASLTDLGQATLPLDNLAFDARFDPDGAVTVFGGTHSHGQGHATVFAQLVHEFLGVPFEQIRYVQGDTAKVQFGRGTYGARSAVVGGSALRRAADAIIDKAKLMAAAMLEADAGDIEFKDGNLKVAGTDKAVPLVEVAKASFAPMGPMTGFGIGLEGSGSHSPEPPSGASEPVLNVIPFFFNQT